MPRRKIAKPWSKPVKSGLSSGMQAWTILVTGNNLDSGFDLRFGCAGWFCILDEETGATRVISGDFGSKAKELLEKFNIQMVLSNRIVLQN